MTKEQPSLVQVGVRVRPGKQESVISNFQQTVEIAGKQFSFDHVFCEGSNQETLYGQVRTLLDGVLEGYNATILAYGQTGSGKTYTMGSCVGDTTITSSSGLIPRFLVDLFARLDDGNTQAKNAPQTRLETSFLEVYGEDIHDLLDPQRPHVTIYEENNQIITKELTKRSISNVSDALQVLHEGTLHRTTASTLMNLTSSRSHAVFTIYMQRDNVSSKLTFVDLAGSERLKKTGASGNLAREGIEINKGLLALGNVINALSEHSKHVPYRQSKLTRLLQDALGGNSQTLFLACVSPDADNASETLSTLHYASRARTIQNTVSKNINISNAEAQLWKSYAVLLQQELTVAKFPNSEPSEITTYFEQLKQAVRQDQDADSTTLQLVSLSSNPDGILPSNNDAMPIDASNNQSVLDAFDPKLLEEVNPDEEMAILDQLLDLQQQDQEYDRLQKSDYEELKQVEGELVEQETMLLQLKESLKVYHSMKSKYETLVTEVQQLEAEKAQLADQLEKAKSDPTTGCSRAIQKEMEKVERNLVRAKQETRKHRQQYKKLEQEAQKCKIMERKVADLKTGRANLIKKQKETAAKHRAWTEQKSREIMSLQRKDRRQSVQITKLQSEMQKYKRNLDKRQEYCKKLLEQKKQTETHLMKLLKMRQKNYRSKRQPATAAELDSVQYLFDKAVNGAVKAGELQKDYENRVNDYSESMRAMMSAVKEDNANLPDLQVKVEIAGDALEKSRNRLGGLKNDVDAKMLVDSQPAPVLRTLLMGAVDSIVESEVNRKQLAKELKQKENVMQSYESEIETLNQTHKVLKNELVQRHSIVNGKVDPIAKVSTLGQENKALLEKVKDSENELQQLHQLVEKQSKENEETALKLAKISEKLAVAEVALSQADGVDAPCHILEQLQTIWDEMGATIAVREEAKLHIENCLEHTCSAELKQAEKWKAETAFRIASMKDQLTSMYASLSMTPDEIMFPTDDVKLLQQLEQLEQHKLRLQPIFSSTIQRRDGMVSQVTDLCFALGIETSTLDSDLVRLLAISTDKESMDGLDESFLTRCDTALMELQKRKSKILASNAKLQQECFSLVSEFNTSKSELLSLVVHSVKRRLSSLPTWWNNDVAETVTRAVTSEGGVVRSSGPFSQHLSLFHESLTSIAKGRRELSDKLRELVERAQKTLLATVDGEFEANEAYSNFHQALFRLPALSKDRINACLSEIDALTTGVEDMSQSEIEALSVVWEALNISMAERGQFWGKINDAVREMQAQPTGPFDDVVQLSRRDGEEWVLAAVKDGTTGYRELEARLFKLEKIHEEVEVLRAKQDAKSKIISLDSEVRLLSSKLSEFEDKTCSKQRLTTKKNTSSNLLKEEQFRKQMQTKFTSKLDLLAKLLAEWKSSEEEAFDHDLLSDDVRSILKTSDRRDFMHLRTVEYKGTSKRSAPTSSTTGSTGPPPSKRFARASQDTGLRVPRIPKEQRKTSSSTNSSPALPIVRSRKRKTNEDIKRPPTNPNLASDRETKRSRPLSSLSSSDGQKKRATATKKRLTLDPFGTVLDKARTPSKRENENATGTTE